MTNRNQKDKPGSVGRHVPLYADTPADLEFDEPSNQCSLITLYEQDAPPRTVPQGQEHYIEVGRYYWIRFDTRGYYWTYCILRLTLHCTPIRVYPSHSYHPPSRALQVDQSKLMNILKCPICLGVFKETVSTANGPSSSANVFQRPPTSLTHPPLSNSTGGPSQLHPPLLQRLHHALLERGDQQQLPHLPVLLQYQETHAYRREPGFSHIESDAGKGG